VFTVIFSGLGLGSLFILSEIASAQTSDPVLIAAGDISRCSHDRDEATAQLLDDIAGTVITLGDNVYPNGTLAQFNDCYEPTWGRHKERTRPSPGNHDYRVYGAAGYYTYFGAAASPLEPNCISNCKGYYSYDLGAWHIVVLNSSINHSAGSPQEKWLRADLAANQSTCTLAYWHHPLFSSGRHGNSPSVQALWQALYDHGADVVLNGHDHTYERFAPQSPTGNAEPTRGIRQFIVGTGGAGLYSFPPNERHPNSEVRNDTTWGVAKLTLHPTTYDWEFIPILGQTFTDSGTASCIDTAESPIVWVEDAMTMVFKDDPAMANSNITLYTAKNEYEPFQIVVKAPALSDLTNVNVTISDLTGPNGASISSDNIKLYREHYLLVTHGSKSYDAETNTPLGPGWYPDALIPFTDPATGKDLTGRLDAVPFNLAAGENQPIWVDIYTPSDVPAGLYNGIATITSNQGTSTVDVSLNVWNFSLPAKRSLGSFAKTVESLRSRATAVELLEHRFNPKFVDRSDERFLIDNHGLDMVHVYDWSNASYRRCLIDPVPPVSEILESTANHEPELYLYNSYANEIWPCTGIYPELFGWATNLRLGEAHPMLFMYPIDELMGPDLNHTAADIWVVLPRHYDQSRTHIETLIDHPNTEVWSYNPLVQEGYSPKYTIDFLPINSRILQGFINQSLGLTGTQFWLVDYWTNDPWDNAEFYRADAPGEGHMAYPGEDVGLPNQIVSGVRLKLFREGSEDFEYIQILKNLGEEQFALDTTRTVAVDFHTWTQDKDVLYAARELLGERIHRLNSDPPSTCSNNYRDLYSNSSPHRDEDGAGH
jgi:hypothetical protein